MADLQYDDEHSGEDTYVASLRVSRITKRAAQGQPAVRQSVTKLERRVIEVASLTIKAGSLDDLVKKLNKHVAIIEED